MEVWAGQVVAGRRIVRDRDAEFRAAGPVRDLVARVGRAREQLRTDLARLEPAAPPHGPVNNPADAELPFGRTQGAALVHLYSELMQHRGQMEDCRDVLLAPWVELATTPHAIAQPDSRYRPAPER